MYKPEKEVQPYMEYIITAICIIAIVIGAGVLLKIRSKSTKKLTDSNLATVEETPLLPTPQEEILHDLDIHLEILPVEEISTESGLVEITDSKILAQANGLISSMVQAGNAVNNAARAAKTQGEVLYRAIIPAGAKLADSKGMEGAVRGFYRGANGIQGQANLVAVEAQKGSAVIANTTAAAMGVASMVVGQYYMAQISTELSQINDGLSKISNFQNNEYRSRVFSLASHVKKIAEFQVEILENGELRLSKIAQLDSLEEECTKLLGQASLSLLDFTKKTDLTFEDYESELQEAQNWYIYQNTLLEMLYKISDLSFTLHLGAVSREQCIASLPPYVQQVEETQVCLTQWHQDTTKRLGIDIAKTRRKRGGLDKAIYFIPGLINDEWNSRAISEKTAEMIGFQTVGHIDLLHDATDLYAEDVQLIFKNGKVYYLPPSKE